MDRVEQGIVDTLFKKVVGDMAATNMSLVPKQDKFHATLNIFLQIEYMGHMETLGPLLDASSNTPQHDYDIF